MINEILTKLCEKLKIKESSLEKPVENKAYKRAVVSGKTLGDLTIEYNHDVDIFETVGLNYNKANIDLDATCLGDEYVLEIRIRIDKKKSFKEYVVQMKADKPFSKKMQDNLHKIRAGENPGESALFVSFEQEEYGQVADFMYGFIMYVDEELKEEKKREKEPTPPAKSNPFFPTRKKSKKIAPGPDKQEDPPFEIFEE